jgi:phosphate uptake regulator
MVMSFFKKGEGGLDHIATRTVSMLADARHSFDLASAVVLSGADAAAIGNDVRATDDRINQAEQDLRGELVVHVAVQGSDDIGEVLGYTLLIKKIERIGDQAKNILDLAEEEVDFSSASDQEELLGISRTISAMMGEAADLLAGAEPEQAADFRTRTDQLRIELDGHIRQFMHSDAPGREAVPRAILYRYWKRIVANLAGVVTTATEPLRHQDYHDHGETDIDDD